ncbi:MAG: DNRLRE domain-containing protein [Candidatus Omnitrophica bacterium]|nr:DNRLRE domain-containing protein [Candidatus Omnitrophota bacterium]
MKKIALLALGLMSLLLLSSQAVAVEPQGPPSPGVELKFWAMEDTYITERYGNTNYGSEEYLRVRDKQTDTSNLFSRSLLKFDQQDLVNKLAGKQILSASLHLYEYSRDGATSLADEIDLFRVTSDWAENDVTWNTSPTFATQRTAYRTFDGDDTTPGWRKWEDDLINIVQWWIDGVQNNFGLMLENDLDQLYNQMNVKFRSSEYLVPDGSSGIYRPYLKITVIPEPASAILFGIGSGLIGIFTARRRKARS